MAGRNGDSFSAPYGIYRSFGLSFLDVDGVCSAADAADVLTLISCATKQAKLGLTTAVYCYLGPRIRGDACQDGVFMEVRYMYRGSSVGLARERAGKGKKHVKANGWNARSSSATAV